MREIKFRFWSTIKEDEMIYPKTGLLSDLVPIKGQWEVMQFTGLTDKNGKDIFEGDILDLHSTVNGVNLFEVYFNEKQARFSIKYYTDRMKGRRLEYEYSVTDFFKPCTFSGEPDFEVIGNIYENTELLKK